MSAQTPVLTFDVGQSSREFGGLERTRRGGRVPIPISFRNVIDDPNAMAKASSTAVLKCFPNARQPKLHRRELSSEVFAHHILECVKVA